MFDPSDLPPEAFPMPADAPAGTPESVPFDPLAFAFDPPAPRDAAAIYAMEIPPDNEHGDGVRNPPVKPCAGIRGNGMLTPRISVHSEDWRDYNYADFNY